MTAGVRERLPNRPVSETSIQRARGGDTAPLSVISLTVVSPIFSQRIASLAATPTLPRRSLILRPPRTGPKTALRLAIPSKAYSPRGILVCARPWAIFGARRVGASDSRDLTMSFRDWQPQYVADGIATIPVGPDKRPLMSRGNRVGVRGSSEIAPQRLRRKARRPALRLHHQRQAGRADALVARVTKEGSMNDNLVPHAHLLILHHNRKGTP